MSAERLPRPPVLATISILAPLLSAMAMAAAAAAAAGCGSESSPPAVIDAAGGGADAAPTGPDAAPPDLRLPWSRQPPGGLAPADVPQLVSITFDDNFGLADPISVGGVDYVVDFFAGKTNPPGAGNADDFDGTPIAATFYYTSIYVVDGAQQVLGGKPGEDRMGRNRAAWSAAFAAGHEAADHTVNHFNGGVVPIDPDDCCRARNWNVGDWKAEIDACRDALSDPTAGIGAGRGDVSGFRTPFLGYNDEVFTALSELGFRYDTTLPNCFADDEDGSNCSWPYTLDEGSPDADVLAAKFTSQAGAVPFSFPAVTSHPGVAELPPTTLVVPPDSAAEEYAFSPGLRARIEERYPLNYPSIYEPSTGKIAGLDYTLLIDAGVTGDEMRAILSYNLDLHLSGNRSPMIVIAHAHLYAFSSEEDNPDTPTAAIRDARWKGMTDFLTYARSRPEVRLVTAKSVLDWVERHAGR